MRRLALILGWLGVVILTTAVTWQIVSAADNRVSERPSLPLNVAAPQLQASGDPTTTTIQTAITQATLTTTSSSTSTTVAGATPITSGQSTTSTSAPAVTITSTAVEWLVKITATGGGTVVVRYRPDEVVFQAASPAVGFHVEVDKAGPPEVEVEFESETLKVKFRAKWNDGQLEVDVSESGSG